MPSCYTYAALHLATIVHALLSHHHHIDNGFCHQVGHAAASQQINSEAHGYPNSDACKGEIWSDGSAIDLHAPITIPADNGRLYSPQLQLICLFISRERSVNNAASLSLSSSSYMHMAAALRVGVLVKSGTNLQCNNMQDQLAKVCRRLTLHYIWWWQLSTTHAL
jgi:hypothetical protein